MTVNSTVTLIPSYMSLVTLQSTVGVGSSTTFSVSTQTDTQVLSGQPGYTIMRAVSGLTADVDVTAEGQAMTRLVVGFTTSASGALISGATFNITSNCGIFDAVATDREVELLSGWHPSAVVVASVLDAGTVLAVALDGVGIPLVGSLTAVSLQIHRGFAPNCASGESTTAVLINVATSADLGLAAGSVPTSGFNADDTVDAITALCAT